MTDVLFITPTGQLQLRQESNGTMILATLLRQAGISARILRFGQMKNMDGDYRLFLEEIVERILSMEPRSVSFYTLWPQYHIMLRIAKELKQRCPELPIVLGGPQASLTAKPTLAAAPYVDYICSGEGELTVVPFFQALLRGDKEKLVQVPGLYYRSGDAVMANPAEVPLCDLNTLAQWDEALFADDYSERKEKLASPGYFMPIEAGRGCPFSCTFCTTSNFWRRTYRLKSAERLIADIRYYKERFGITSFLFSHDAFTANMRLVEEVCDRLIAEDLQIRWTCSSRIDRMTEALARKMIQAGMVRIELGVETGSQDMQRRINKHLDLAQVRRMTEFLLSQKIRVVLFFMHGFPDETEEELAQTVSLHMDMLDAGVYYASMSFCRFNPGTAITEQFFDKLELDPVCKIVSRGLPMGFHEEFPFIAANKEIFPFYRHLNTPVRNQYQYLVYFSHMYQKHLKICKLARTFYNGDDLQFYREWYEASSELLREDITTIEKEIVRSEPQILARVLERHPVSGIRQLMQMLEYEADVRQISEAEEDTTLRRTYGFLFAEYLLSVPVDQLTDGTSEIVLKMENGKFSYQLLSMNVRTDN